MPGFARWVLIAALAAVPVHAQIDPRGALLERAGWEAIAAGQGAAAAKAFREALAADPKNARLHLGAGMAAALERRDEDARDSFERALDRKSTRLNSSHLGISYAVFCLKKKTITAHCPPTWRSPRKSSVGITAPSMRRGTACQARVRSGGRSRALDDIVLRIGSQGSKT